MELNLNYPEIYFFKIAIVKAAYGSSSVTAEAHAEIYTKQLQKKTLD